MLRRHKTMGLRGNLMRQNLKPLVALAVIALALVCLAAPARADTRWGRLAPGPGGQDHCGRLYPQYGGQGRRHRSGLGRILELGGAPGPGRLRDPARRCQRGGGAGRELLPKPGPEGRRHRGGLGKAMASAPPRPASTAWWRWPRAFYHCLALKADGTVVAWGVDWASATPPADLNGVVAVAAGQVQSLAVKTDGTVVAWGAWYDQWTVPAGLSGVVAVAAGALHHLALKGDGTVVAWAWGGEVTSGASATSRTASAAWWRWPRGGTTAWP